MNAHPFLKWVGGKRQLLPELLARVPARYGTYHEPFLGGAALFFAMQPKRAVLSDSNLRLIRTYRAVRNDVEEVIHRLKAMAYDRKLYEEIRAMEIDDFDDVGVAIWMLYLNRCGFNGLYRVNRAGKFNVHFGRYTNPKICDEDNLRACSAVLQSASIEHRSFEGIVDHANSGDFVYFDPPYVPLSATSVFTSYTSDGFRASDQEHLRDAAAYLSRHGVHVLLSNSSAPAVHDLYGDGFRIELVSARRNVNSKTTARGAVKECLITPVARLPQIADREPSINPGDEQC